MAIRWVSEKDFLPPSIQGCQRRLTARYIISSLLIEHWDFPEHVHYMRFNDDRRATTLTKRFNNDEDRLQTIVLHE